MTDDLKVFFFFLFLKLTVGCSDTMRLFSQPLLKSANRFEEVGPDSRSLEAVRKNLVSVLYPYTLGEGSIDIDIEYLDRVSVSLFASRQS